MINKLQERMRIYGKKSYFFRFFLCNSLTLLLMSGLLLMLAACPVPPNVVVRLPVDSVKLSKNREPVPQGGFDILEGQSVIMGAQLFPAGVYGGIHWQSSRRGVVELSGLSGPELSLSGANGGKTIISVLARNPLNEAYVQAECTVTVIPSSFFKWNYKEDGWLDMNAHENRIIGTLNEMPVRSGQTPIPADEARGAMVLQGPGTLIIGSGMTTETSSPFADDPAYDARGEFDFLEGPSFDYLEYNAAGTEQLLEHKYYPFWNGRVKISVEYEMPDSSGGVLLRIQVNNNTLERDNASSIDNWLLAELGPDAPRAGALTGIYNGNTARLDPLLNPAKKAAIAGANDEAKLAEVLGHSFVCLALPDGKILIRSIRIVSE